MIGRIVFTTQEGGAGEIIIMNRKKLKQIGFLLKENAFIKTAIFYPNNKGRNYVNTDYVVLKGKLS